MSEHVTEEEMIRARQVISGAAFAARSGLSVPHQDLVHADDVIRGLWMEVRDTRAKAIGEQNT